MAKTVTLKDTTTEEALYPMTLPENVVNSNGDSILELIEARTEFFVPTLLSAPTSSTLAYTKDGNSVDFVLGQFCRVANAQSSTGYDFYQLQNLVTSNNVTTASWAVTGGVEPTSTAGSAWSNFSLR